MTAAIRLYEQLLLRNLSAVQSIESGIRNVTWLLPGRFEDSEVASEGCPLPPSSTILLLTSSDNPLERRIRVSRHTHH